VPHPPQIHCPKPDNQNTWSAPASVQRPAAYVDQNRRKPSSLTIICSFPIVGVGRPSGPAIPSRQHRASAAPAAQHQLQLPQGSAPRTHPASSRSQCSPARISAGQSKPVPRLHAQTPRATTPAARLRRNAIAPRQSRPCASASRVQSQSHRRASPAHSSAQHITRAETCHSRNRCKTKAAISDGSPDPPPARQRAQRQSRIRWSGRQRTSPTSPRQRFSMLIQPGSKRWQRTATAPAEASDSQYVASPFNLAPHTPRSQPEMALATPPNLGNHHLKIRRQPVKRATGAPLVCGRIAGTPSGARDRGRAYHRRPPAARAKPPLAVQRSPTSTRFRVEADPRGRAKPAAVSSCQPVVISTLTKRVLACLNSPCSKYSYRVPWR